MPDTSQYPRWTPDEDDYLRHEYATLGPRTIAGQLGRSNQAVINRAHRLGLGTERPERGPGKRQGDPSPDEIAARADEIRQSRSADHGRS